MTTGWKQETRIGVAAVLSFLILVTALIANRGRKGKPAPAMALPPAATAPPARAAVARPRAHAGVGEPGTAKPRPTREMLLAMADGPDPLPPPEAPPEPMPAVKPAEGGELLLPPPVDAKAGATSEPTPDLPAPTPDPATPAPAESPKGPADAAGSALPEVKPTTGGLDRPSQPAKEPAEESSARPPELPRDPIDPKGPGTATPAPAPAGGSNPPAPGGAESPLDGPSTAAVSAEARPPSETPASPIQEPEPTPPPEKADAPRSMAVEPARPREAPSFAPAPTGPEPAAPAREGGQGTWVTLPNTSAKAPDDEPTPRNDLAASTSSGRGEPVAAASVDRVEPVPHVVQRGENFWTISRLYYGSGRYYRALWKANSRLVEKPEKLYVGMTIRIPPPEALDRSLIEPPKSETPVKRLRKTSQPAARVDRGAADTPSSARQASEKDLALPVVDPLSDRGTKTPREFEPGPSTEVRYRPRRPLYRVRSGTETLRSVARDTLGDSHRADEILELNRDVVKDPRQLVVGQVLELPEDARVSSRAP